MTTTKVETKEGQNHFLPVLAIAVVILIGLAVWLGWASVTGGDTGDLLASELAPQLTALEQLAPSSQESLSASEALATGEPVLFVFVPFEKCSQQYCLTADVVEKKLPDSLANAFYIVEVPVHSFYIYTIDTPPDFIVADWDLYPTYPQTDWLPEAELTEFGWGISQTQLVLVNENGEMTYQSQSEGQFEFDLEALRNSFD